MQTFPCIVWLQKAAKSLGRREGAVAGFFSPSPQREQELQNSQVGVGRLFQVLGDAEELGEDRMGSPAGQGWVVRWRHELVFGSSPAKG